VNEYILHRPTMFKHSIGEKLPIDLKTLVRLTFYLNERKLTLRYMF